MQASIVNLLQIAGIHMSAIHAVDATPQPDAEAITPSNKALNTLGTTPINVYILFSHLKDYIKQNLSLLMEFYMAFISSIPPYPNRAVWLWSIRFKSQEK